MATKLNTTFIGIVIAVVVFSESLSIVQIVSLGLIVAGVVGLHLGGTGTAVPHP